jgi:hypothetical protein
LQVMGIDGDFFGFCVWLGGGIFGVWDGNQWLDFL